MPEQKQAKSHPPDIVARIILGEAAGEGPAGMMFVRDVLANRAKTQKKTLEEVATAPKQFSAYSRPDLEAFYSRQPAILRNLANALVAEARRPDFVPQYEGIEHFENIRNWERRHELPDTHWFNRMEEVGRVGNHVALRPRR